MEVFLLLTITFKRFLPNVPILYPLKTPKKQRFSGVSNWYKLETTAWKVSKYGVFSGPYFPVLGLNKEIYSVNLCINSKCGKIQIRENSVFGHFSCGEHWPEMG